MVTAKQAVLHGSRDLRIEDVELDTGNLGSHEVWVETEISALKIGTDRGNYEGAEYGLGAANYPRNVGDSTVGIVRGIGSEVTRFAVGDRVADRHGHGSAHIYDTRQSNERYQCTGSGSSQTYPYDPRNALQGGRRWPTTNTRALRSLWRPTNGPAS